MQRDSLIGHRWATSVLFEKNGVITAGLTERGSRDRVSDATQSGWRVGYTLAFRRERAK